MPAFTSLAAAKGTLTGPSRVLRPLRWQECSPGHTLLRLAEQTITPAAVAGDPN